MIEVKNSFNEKIESMADIIRNQHHNVTVNTYLSFESTADVIERYREIHARGQTVSHTGFKVLNTLVLFGGSMFPTEISKKIFRSKHAVSKVIFTLESHGMVEINTVGEDRRKKEVKITPRGLATATKGDIYARQHMSHKVFSILSKEEMKFMNEVLGKVKKHTMNLVKTET